MSASKTPEINDFEEEEKEEKEEEKEKEKEIEESEETSIIDDNETNEQNNELDTITTHFDEICNGSYTILNTLKSKMNAITKMYDDFNETTITFNNISTDCKLLLNTMNGRNKSDSINKWLTNIQYSKTYLKSLSKSQLIDIIILMQRNDPDKFKFKKHKKTSREKKRLHKSNSYERRPKMRNKGSNKSIRNKDKHQIENDSMDGSGNSLNNSILIEVDESMIDEDDDDDDYDNETMLETELLKLNMKMLKKRCKEYRVSAQGGKIDMISKILKEENKLKQELVNEDLSAHDDFMEEMNELSGR